MSIMGEQQGKTLPKWHVDSGRKQPIQKQTDSISPIQTTKEFDCKKSKIVNEREKTTAIHHHHYHQHYHGHAMHDAICTCAAMGGNDIERERQRMLNEQMAVWGRRCNNMHPHIFANIRPENFCPRSKSQVRTRKMMPATKFPGQWPKNNVITGTM